jgi:hypothetical protein
MLRDVFYFGEKPNVHPREKFATDLVDAKRQCTTEHFWVINEHCNYKDFDWDWDFDFLPDEDVWAEEHNNVWPSPYQKDSGTCLCSTNLDAVTIYRADVDPIPLKDEITNCWKIIEYIEKDKFDFKWHPDPTDPPYIYVWGNKWYPGTIMPTVEYHVPGATDRKYILDHLAPLLPMPMLFNIIYEPADFDYTWRPDPTAPPYIYVFGNNQYPASVMPTVEFHVKGATERKFIENIVPKLSARPDDFETLEDIDPTSFDMTWVPDPTAPPYIYAWGNQWNKPEDKISVIRKVEGATEYKYMEERAKRNPCMDNWIIPSNMFQNKFDFSWEPNPHDPPFIYQFGTQWQKTGGPRYIVEGATEIKYIDAVKAEVVCTQFENWQVPRNIDQTKFDFSWHPDETEEPFIYQFPNQWARTGGPRFVVDGATEIKYIDAQVATAKQDKTHWTIPAGIDTTDFDFSWHPDIDHAPLIYQFGTQWQRTGGPSFYAVGCTEDSDIEYVNVTKAKALPTVDNWETLIPIKDFDYSWHPDTTEEPFIYVFGNQWFDAVTEPTVIYTVPGATQKKYINDVTANVAPTTENWETLIPVDSFDYSWRPHPDSPPYIYVWGNQWNNCFIEPTVVYRIPGATEYKYIEDNVAMVKSTEKDPKWEILLSISKFDFSWRPDPSEPPFIYVFGNKWNDAETEPTVMYRVEGSTEYKFLDSIIATPKVNMTNWLVRNELDLKAFDFSWRPNPNKDPARYEWGTDGPVYIVPDFKSTITLDYDESIRENVVVETTDEVIQKIIHRDMFFVDKGNSESSYRLEKLKLQFPSIQKTRYLNSWVETISRCTSKSTTELFWVLSSELDYTEFNFDHNPNPWQKRMIHVFGSQWTHWGNTYLVNKNTFNEDTKYVKIIEHLSMLNFVKDKRAKAEGSLYDVILINHGNKSDVSEVIKSKIGNKSITTVDYKHSYLKTFKEILKKLDTRKEHYLWICSSICDYANFDFSYICDPYAREQLHVFPSDKQKFGDTFLIDVNKFKSLIDDMIMMEDYEKVNYNQHQRVKRLPAPVIITKEDTHVTNIHTDFDWPYATFVTEDNKELDIHDSEPISLWTPDTKNILITSTGATRIVVPKEAKDYVENELYDYPYISRSKSLAQSQPLDIVFLSNGETGADENYEHLLKVTKGLRNRVVRVDGVNGRVQAYHAAAEASETPWMFTVFAKLKVNSKFDWTWQPDRLQIPKHYIFNATNPVNGLEYGHQAMIAYNKKITLGNSGTGLDFTLDNEHEVVEVNSGVAMYNTDEWSTWRTSFREALKLKATVVNNPDDTISIERLLAWSTKGKGNFGEHSINGALDAIEYYDSVNGDINKLRLSYDWPWLKEFFNNKYK